MLAVNAFLVKRGCYSMSHKFGKNGDSTNRKCGINGDSADC